LDPAVTRVLPVGEPVDVAPAARPGPVMLEGRFGRVEKADPSRHTEQLWEAFAGHAALWTYMRHGPFSNAAAFGQWFAERAGRADPYCYAILDGASGRARGVAALMEIRPDMRVIEIGQIAYAPAMQRTPLATEAQ
jgi:RimJ/RimL family protein N-acetyltransferase